MASKLRVHEPNTFFGYRQGNQWKTELFRKSLRSRKFSIGTFFGAYTQTILTHSAFRKNPYNFVENFFGPCFGRSKLGECDKMRSVSKIMRRCKKHISHNFWNWAMGRSDLRGEAQFRNFWEIRFVVTPHISANRPHLVALTRLRATKTRSKIFVPPFHRDILNPECIRIPWVLAPKNFPVQNFRVRSVLQKSSSFHWFLLPPPKKKYRARVPTIMMPQTFLIASLNSYTPNFSGAPQ